MNEDLTKKIQQLQSRLTGSYFLEAQEIQINDDFTFETVSGEIAFINHQGEMVLLNQKDVLDVLTQHKDNNRYVPESVDKGDVSAIQTLVASLKHWLDNQAIELQKQDDGTTKK